MNAQALLTRKTIMIYDYPIHMKRALLALSLALLVLSQMTSFAATQYVTNTLNSGPGSLRQAIIDANNGDTISFSLSAAGVGPSAGEGSSGWVSTEVPGYKWFRIVVATPLTVDKNNLVIDGTTCTTSDAVNPAGGPVIQIIAPISDAFSLEGTGNTIKGFCINSVTNCIHSTGSNNIIIGNYIGINVSGESRTSSVCEAGIVISAESNIIGGATAAERNVISGCDFFAIETILGGSHIIKGNYIGLTASGEGIIPNNLTGIVTIGGDDNIIGGLNPGEGNVVSGNGTTDPTLGGIVILSQFPAQRTGIYGNFVGTNASGTRALPNMSGITVAGHDKYTMVGNGTPAGRNIISGNSVAGLIIYGPTPSITVESTYVYGNYIGTDKTGSTAIGNGAANIFVLGPVKNVRIGGSIAGQGNVISGNTVGFSGGIDLPGCGIAVAQSIGVSSMEVLGNLIGVAADGISPLGNDIGVYITKEAKYCRIGDGTAGGSNTIAYNTIAGVSIEGIGTDFNKISRNSIYSNSVIGIRLKDGANSGIGTAAISSVTSDGVSVTISGTSAVPYSVIEVFKSSGAQGKNYFGSINSDTSGNWSGIIPAEAGMSAGDAVTVTQTDPNNNTSEFSIIKEATITPSSAHHLAVELPSTGVVSGAAFSATVSLKDTAGNTVPMNYVTTHVTVDAGSVTPSSIDPSEYVSGVWTGNMVLDKAGSRTLYFTYGSGVASGTGTVLVAGATPANMVRFGPNPFNPSSGSGVFWYHLDSSNETTIYLLDLSGTVVWKAVYPSGGAGGSEGANSVTYDGRTSWGDVLGNGVYIFKVVQGGKSVGGGKIAVIK